MKLLKKSFVLILSLMLVFTIGCQKEVTDQQLETYDLSNKKANSDEPIELAGIIYDISDTPDGGLMAAVDEGTKSIKIIRNGKVIPMNTIDSQTAIQGVEALDGSKAFAITGAIDLAVGGALYSVSQGYTKMVADLSQFEKDNDPDAFAGFEWKDQRCEAIDGFSAGPQNNPFKLLALSRESVIVADAAANTVLSANVSGDIDWKAILPPPSDEDGWMVRWNATEDEDVPCYVQPVPTSVAMDDEGNLYVGELTGALAPEDGLPVNRSRVWKLPLDGNNLACSVDGSECNVLIDGLTSVMDVAIGPDGLLYVVEFDANSWLSSVVEAIPWGGGTVTAFDPETGQEEKVIESDLVYPTAISFDKWGNLWVAENGAFIGAASTIRMIEL